MAKIEWNKAAEAELLRSEGVRRKLDAVAFTITAHAIPLSGRDTGRLVNSMDHSITLDGGTLVAHLGSNASTGTNAVGYASMNWAGKGEWVTNDERRLRRRRRGPNPGRKPVPTRPYAKAMRALGIRFKKNQGVES